MFSKGVPPKVGTVLISQKESMNVASENIKKANNGNNQEVVFKSSPALDSLRIPKPRRVSRTTGAMPAATAAASIDSTDSNSGGGYRWPVAFVVASAIFVGGFLVYQKMNKVPETATDQKALAQTTIEPSHPPKLATAAPAETKEAEDAVKKADVEDKKADEDQANDDKTNAKKEDKVKDKIAVAKKTTHKAIAKKVAKVAADKKDTVAKVKTPDFVKNAAPIKKKVAAKTSGKKDDLDSLIDNTIAGGVAAPTPKPAAPKKEVKKAPTTLTKKQIATGMRKIRSRIGACYDKYQVEGVARVKLTITKAGKPTNISVAGKFFGTDTGACVKKAVGAARFPTFTGNEPTFVYPFQLSE